jgi:hypothetical protein
MWLRFAERALGHFIYESAALSPQAVASLASDSAPGVDAATDGNPFLVTELLCSDDAALPVTVANAVLGRAAQPGVDSTIGSMCVERRGLLYLSTFVRSG